eukprot:scaffold572_cov229-Amphora_coffeaeformis.AAC.14
MKAETLCQEIEELENQLKKKKQELDALLPEKADDDRLIAANEKNQTDAQVTYDNASQILKVCNVLVDFLTSIVDMHENKNNKRSQLLLAAFQSPLELGVELGITKFQYFVDKDKRWNYLYGLYLYIQYFCYQYSNACRSVFPVGLPAVRTHTPKNAKKKKRKRDDAGGEFIQKLLKKARIKDVETAQDMEGDFVANLYMLHRNHFQGHANSSSSNDNSAGNIPGSTAGAANTSSSNENSAGNISNSTAGAASTSSTSSSNQNSTENMPSFTASGP